jgi:radical SAM superfamily enzyme
MLCPQKKLKMSKDGTIYCVDVSPSMQEVVHGKSNLDRCREALCQMLHAKVSFIGIFSMHTLPVNQAHCLKVMSERKTDLVQLIMLGTEGLI